MLTILIHSSKTMRTPRDDSSAYQEPVLHAYASEIAGYLSKLSVARIQSIMKISKSKAEHVKTMYANWADAPETFLPAIDAFIGDIYSGLQVDSFTTADRAYANNHLVILSGLYGSLKALDSVQPYRLEMGYKLSKKMYNSLYNYWGARIADTIPKKAILVNVSAVEYTKVILPHLPDATVITPKFLTASPSGEAKFVVVHAKIARGAFAHWLIKNRIDDVEKLSTFNELGYAYSPELSTKDIPVFVCEKFGGLGLSVRLK